MGSPLQYCLFVRFQFVMLPCKISSTQAGAQQCSTGVRRASELDLVKGALSSPHTYFLTCRLTSKGGCSSDAPL